MKSLNLGILAHVDAGKTTLTERLLYNAGVIDEIGSVDAGSTQTDSLALERQRGITIKSAVVSFVASDITINLIDTPGHPDFIAEVERVLGVLDGAVLVISAVEGVQAQTRVLMRTLQRLRIPTLIFVNKIDRRGAREAEVLEAIAEKLTPGIIAMGSAEGLGTQEARFTAFRANDASFNGRLAGLLAERDESLLAAFVEGQRNVSYRRLRKALAAQSRKAVVHPVYFGSAITGAGVEALTRGITELLPATEGDSDAPSGTVFKVERGPAGEKIAYVRMFSGAVHTRDRLKFGRGNEGKVTAIRVFDRGSTVQRAAVCAGEIAKVWGLADIQIGDTLGEMRGPAGEHFFAPPTLETVVVPANPGDRGSLRVALGQLAEQDPLINLRQDDVRQEIFVSLYGEVQKEVIQATLANDYGIDVGFRETTTICIERPIGTGEAVEVLYARTKTNITGNCSPVSSNPFAATVGLRVEPAPIGSGIEFRLEIDFRLVPTYIYKSAETFAEHMNTYVRETLQEGLHGWQATDCLVTMFDCGYRETGSTAADFRKLTPLVLMEALKQAGTVVCEPIHQYHLEIPAETLGAVIPALSRLSAAPLAQEVSGASYALEGEIAAAHVHELQQLLPGLTGGEGVLEYEFERYRPVRAEIPLRQRTDNNPLDRKEYLLHVQRRM